MPATVVREVRLILSDVINNNNKFWTATLHEDNSVFVRWGRVGDAGQSQTKNHPSRSAAERFIESKVREKKGKGYSEQKTIEAGTVVVKEVKGDLAAIATKQIAHSGNKLVTGLIKRLAERNAHDILQRTTMSYNATTGLFSTPCGIVTQDGIDHARTLLEQIAEFVDGKQFRDPAYIKLLNEYLRCIPQKTGRKLNPETLYPDIESVRAQNQILEALEGSLKVASQPTTKTETVQEPEQRLFAVKLDYVEDGKEIDRVRKLYNKTRQSIHACYGLDVKCVYSVEIEHMARGYAEDGAKVGGEMELWHGSNVGNLLSIMKSGFMVPPANAGHCAGRNFGHGVYFSDQSTKSLNYAYGYWHGSADNNCFMFLNRVAMGKPYIPKSSAEAKTWSKAPKGYDSCFAKVGETDYLKNNEMIVYRTTQINPLLLIEFSEGGK